VKRGRRFVHGDKELVEKLGRNDPCPCGSTRRFKTVLPAQRSSRRRRTAQLSTGIEHAPANAAPEDRGGTFPDRTGRPAGDCYTRTEFGPEELPA